MGFEPQSSLSISRLFLENAKRDNVRDVTPMKMVKLVYIAHGWVLCFKKKPLLFERIQAWKFGPVVPNVYHEFKRFGSEPIPLVQAGFLPEPHISDTEVNDVLSGVWGGYKGFSGGQLSTMTHQPETPWYVTWYDRGGSEGRGVIIDNELIREHYSELLNRMNTK